jgi:Ser-tRNA(Ala) deacylase AlaX
MMTTLLYLDRPEAMRCVASVEAVIWDEANPSLVLDVSCFFSRSGGQPSDRGRILGPAGEMQVERVIRSEDGTVHHLGSIRGTFEVGHRVEAQIDEDWRRLTARTHSAGEILCAAVHELGRRWTVGAASHVPGQSRVSFYTDLGPGQLDEFVGALRERVQGIIARDEEVLTIQNVSEAEAARLCAMDQAILREKKGKIRLVSPTRGFFRPCTGSHVRRTSEIGQIHFRKVRLRGAELSVAYDVQLDDSTGDKRQLGS